MPRVTGPLFSVTAKGTLADALTFQGGPSGVRVQKVPRHRDRDSNTQSIQRASFVSAVSQWHNLSEGTKATYEAEALQFHMTGYNRYIKLCLLGLVAPPAVGFPYTFPIVWA